MKVAEQIQQKIEAGMTFAELDITDESHLHAGHSGAREGGESHFRLRVVSEMFASLSRLERQLLILDLLKEELAGPVHALAIKALTPEEAQK